MVIWKKDNYRIIAIRDIYCNLSDLKGDMFCPVLNHDIDARELEKQEADFEELVYDEGVYGFMLEQWCPEVDVGWTEIDACWGFVGLTHADGNDHYIIEELKSQIPKGENNE